jgi:hypothetical protein
MIANRQARHFGEIGVNDMPTLSQAEAVADTIWHLRKLDARSSDPQFLLDMGLSALLAIPENPSLLNAARSKLLVAVLAAHAEAIAQTADRLEIEHVNSGMGAAFALVEGLYAGRTASDQHQDARAQIKILIHRIRILEHQRNIESRRLARRQAAVASLNPPRAAAEAFG